MNGLRVKVRHLAHEIHGLGDLAHHILADAAIHTFKAAKIFTLAKVVFA